MILQTITNILTTLPINVMSSQLQQTPFIKELLASEGYSSDVNQFLDRLVVELSPADKHYLTLKLVDDYGFGGDGSAFHMCNVCNVKDYERGGQGSSIDFNYCSTRGCQTVVCEKCLKAAISVGDTLLVKSYESKYGDFTCGLHHESV